MNYIIYNKKTGVPRISIDNESLVGANIADGEAWIKVEQKDQINGEFKIIDGKPVAAPPPPEDPVQISRELRAGLLQESDWTQNADSPLTTDVKAQWADYRQKLRDFPALIESNFNSANEKFYLEFMSLLPEKPDS